MAQVVGAQSLSGVHLPTWTQLEFQPQMAPAAATKVKKKLNQIILDVLYPCIGPGWPLTKVTTVMRMNRVTRVTRVTRATWMTIDQGDQGD